jgi:phosphate transport system substrate-binding protein
MNKPQASVGAVQRYKEWKARMSTPPSSIQRGARQGRVSLGVIIAIVVVVAAVGAGVAYYALVPRGGPEIVVVDGSSTVFPITSAWAGSFNNDQRQVVVRFSGTGGGFEKFCRGETDLSDASRPIRQSEVDLCTANGVTGIVEFLVAYDGLSVVVNHNNDWASDLTVAQLCRIWTGSTSASVCGGAGGPVTRWNELDPSWPDQEISLYGPGTDSGTFDYFVEVILDPFDETITPDFFPSEDDNVLVQGIAGDQYALGYFGYAYAIANTASLKILAIDDEDPTNGDGPIFPSEETVKDGTYAPLSRPLFVYGNSRSLGRTVVEDFLRFGFSGPGQVLVGQTGYVTLNANEVQAQLAKL